MFAYRFLQYASQHISQAPASKKGPIKVLALSFTAATALYSLGVNNQTFCSVGTNANTHHGTNTNTHHGTHGPSHNTFASHPASSMTPSALHSEAPKASQSTPIKYAAAPPAPAASPRMETVHAPHHSATTDGAKAQQTAPPPSANVGPKAAPAPQGPQQASKPQAPTGAPPRRPFFSASTVPASFSASKPRVFYDAPDPADLARPGVPSGSDGLLIQLVVDESGSMLSRRSQTIEQINGYIASQRAAAAQPAAGNCFVSLCKFNSVVTEVIRMLDIRDFQPITGADYVPWGLTHLRDAVGLTVLKIDRFLPARPGAHRTRLHCIR